MQYDKYGDPIETDTPALNRKTHKAFLILAAVQAVLILLNLPILLIPALNLYLCFITAPFYIFVYILFQKGCGNAKDTGNLPGYCKWVAVLSPLVYILTAVLAVFGGM